MLSMNNKLLIDTISSYFLENEHYEEVTVLSNASAIIKQLFPRINWVGFYLLKDGTLKLGPFQGKPACMHIPLNKGVCGYCARTMKSIVVDNVHEFVDHIACDSESKSELVIPIIINDSLYGLLDIDSPEYSRFSNDDLKTFESIVNIIINIIKK